MDADISAFRPVISLLSRRGVTVDLARSFSDGMDYLEHRRRDDLALLILEPIIPAVTDAAAAAASSVEPRVTEELVRTRYLGLSLLEEYPRLAPRTIILTVADPTVLLETHPVARECAGVLRKGRLAFEFLQFEKILDEVLNRGARKPQMPEAAGAGEGATL